MKNIIIYTTTICPYCIRAKALLDRKGFKYEEINVEDADLRTKMIERTGGARSVPQIFIGDDHIGGSDDLYALESDGKLDGMVN